MKTYYIEFTNGDSDFVDARTDHSAYIKACKLAKAIWSDVLRIWESFDDEAEADRRVY